MHKLLKPVCHQIADRGRYVFESAYTTCVYVYMYVIPSEVGVPMCLSVLESEACPWSVCLTDGGRFCACQI